MATTTTTTTSRCNICDVCIVKILKNKIVKIQKEMKKKTRIETNKTRKNFCNTNHFLLNFHEHFIGKHGEKGICAKVQIHCNFTSAFQVYKILWAKQNVFYSFENSTRNMIKLYRQFGFLFPCPLPFLFAFVFSVSFAHMYVRYSHFFGLNYVAMQYSIYEAPVYGQRQIQLMPFCAMAIVA